MADNIKNNIKISIQELKKAVLTLNETTTFAKQAGSEDSAQFKIARDACLQRFEYCMKWGMTDEQFLLLNNLVITPLKKLGADVYIFGSRLSGSITLEDVLKYRIKI